MLYAVLAQMDEDGVHMGEVVRHLCVDFVQKLCSEYSEYSEHSEYSEYLKDSE